MVAVIGTVTTVAPATHGGIAAGGAAPGAVRPRSHGLTFGQVLSYLNPLQYVPVVGTVYRAVTGDTIPTAVREAGGLVFSAVTGGPIGVAITAATDVGERIAGINEEAIGQRVLRWLGIGGGGHARDGATVAATGAGAQANGRDHTTTSGGQENAAATGAAHLAATGSATKGLAAAETATAFTDAELARAGSQGADALNGLELQRLAVNATQAYGRSAALE